ncbi:MAG TPA: class I SAM-dependent methyltransferase [Candidatus Dormibacteraeota bacterium]|nr:class I SAM-dependent methyltransferase [Candidatus Dormibacteraeota bacterium]
MSKSAIPGIGYELLDAGVRRRLERFGGLTIDRPAPMADGFRLAPDAWASADLRFDVGPGWSGAWWPADPWPIELAGLTLELRPTSSGGVGLYPEHVANLAWLEAAVAARVAAIRADPEPPQVLNLFAHTGLATLALARAGAAVAHVDGAKAAVAWARRNAELSGLADRPIRWLVDDAASFVAREARRGRRYDGIVLDPPAFGRGAGREWHIEADLPPLLGACREIAAPGAFVLLTAHSEEIDGSSLRALARDALQARTVEVVRLEQVAASGAQLALGWAVRIDRGVQVGA